MSINIVLAILVTSFATYLSRFLGVVSSEKIKEKSKIFKWFNCLSYSPLAALITRILIFLLGVMSEVDYLIRFIVVFISILIFYFTKKNLVYPTVFSAIILALLSNILG
jgi:branched-subunit amino acid transport protein